MIIEWNKQFNIKVFSFVLQNKDKCCWKYNPVQLDIQDDIVPDFYKLLVDSEIEIPDEIANSIARNGVPIPNDSNICSIIPRDYQLADAEIILDRKRMILSSEQGTGKTLVAIIAGSRIAGRKLVVAPAILIYNWAIEIAQYDSKAKVVVCDSTKVDLTTIDADWIICSYNRLMYICDNICQLHFSAFFADECQNMKSVNGYGLPGSKRAMYCLKIANMVDYFVGISGTPITNKFVDFFNILCAIHAWEITFHGDFIAFTDYYCRPRKQYTSRGNYVWVYDGFDHVNEFRTKISNYMIRRLRKDILPDLTKQRQMIPTKVKSLTYHKYNRSSFVNDLFHAKKELAIAKVPYTISFIKELLIEGEKVVVFSSHIDPLYILQRTFSDSLLIDGDTPNLQRTKMITQFQSDPQTRLILISLLCGGTGITLTAAHCVVFNDFDFSPANMLQGEDRVCRIGQDKLCRIYYIYAANSKLDSHLCRIINRKYEMLSTILDDDKAAMLQTEASVIDELKLYLLKEEQNEGSRHYR